MFLQRLLPPTIATFVLLAVAPALSAGRPNVLIIIGDDCTYSDLPLHGGQNVETPHIDKLAREGLQFTHAYVSFNRRRTEAGLAKQWR